MHCSANNMTQLKELILIMVERNWMLVCSCATQTGSQSLACQQRRLAMITWLGSARLWVKTRFKKERLNFGLGWHIGTDWSTWNRFLHYPWLNLTKIEKLLQWHKTSFGRQTYSKTQINDKTIWAKVCGEQINAQKSWIETFQEWECISIFMSWTLGQKCLLGIWKSLDHQELKIGKPLLYMLSFSWMARTDIFSFLIHCCFCCCEYFRRRRATYFFNGGWKC